MDRMAGVRQRIREVLDRSGLSAREFSRGARLASETHLGLILSGKTKAIQLDTLEAIARFGGVSVEYLRSGKAEPPEQLGVELETHPDPEFPHAARAFLALRKYSSDAMAVVRHYFAVKPEHPLSADEWFEELSLEHRRRMRGLSGEVLPVPATDSAPPLPPSAPRVGRRKRQSSHPK